MKVLIIDDSRLARLELAAQLQQIKGAEWVGEAANIEEAKQAVLALQPDVLLLDIHMPGGDGFQLLEQLQPVPQVIFVTAYDQYAVKSFEYNALDYLLKPVTQARLQAAFAKLQPNIPMNAEVLDAESRFFIKDGERCFFVRLNDVLAFESLGNYSKVHLVQESPAIYRSISAIEQRLPSQLFFRANRSWLINTRFIQAIAPAVSGGFEVTMPHGLVVEISRRQAAEFRQRWSL